MIIEAVLNIVFGLVEGVLSLVPAVEWNVNASFFSSALDFVRLACYMLPMDTIIQIIMIINLIMGWRIAIALLRTIWDVLPLV